MKQQAAQVYYPKGAYLQLKIVAAEEGKPLASWIRDVTLREMEKKLKKKKSLSQMKTYSFPGVDPGTSQKVDEIVYGITR